MENKKMYVEVKNYETNEIIYAFDLEKDYAIHTASSKLYSNILISGLYSGKVLFELQVKEVRATHNYNNGIYINVVLLEVAK